MARVELSGINKSYGAQRALRDLNLVVENGEFFVLLGRTGAGKTTTLRMIAGLEKPDSGTVTIGGKDVGGWTAAERDVALVLQQYSLYPRLTVRGNLEFPLRAPGRNFSDSEIAARVDKAAKTLQITHLLDRKVERLSGGEMQRVSIGRAIVRQPSVFLMDEPLSALDKSLREEMQIEIRELHDKLRITTLYVTHDQREALTIADRIAVMDQGRIVQIDTPEVIYRRPQTSFVARFIGEAAILPVGALAPAAVVGALAAGRPRAVIRSEDFCLTPPGGDAAPVQVSGKVQNLVFQGDSWLIRVRLADGTAIDVRAQRQFSDQVARLAPGAEIALWLPADRLHFLAEEA